MGENSRRSHDAPAWARELAQVVRARRRQLRFSQRELAELASVGPDFLYDLERGKPTVRLGTVMQVLDALGIDVRYVPRSSGVGTAVGEWSAEKEPR